MRKIYFLALGILTQVCIGQTAINFDASSTAGTGWVGYMNVFDNPHDGNQGGYQFESSWGVADLIAEVDAGANTVALKPNRIGDTDSYWQSSGVLEGNKIMEANMYIQDDLLAGSSFTFNGEVISNTLDGSSLSFDFVYQAFIKVFASDYSSVLASDTYSLAPGTFSLTMDATSYTNGEHIQYGFMVLGPNINSDPSFDTAYANLGSIVIGEDMTLTINENRLNKIKAFPNPTISFWNLDNQERNIQSIELFNITGKRILAQDVEGEDEIIINSENLNKGLYIARVKTTKGMTSVKLVKE